jgi:hypothetical protein
MYYDWNTVINFWVHIGGTLQDISAARMLRAFLHIGLVSQKRRALLVLSVTVMAFHNPIDLTTIG